MIMAPIRFPELTVRSRMIVNAIDLTLDLASIAVTSLIPVEFTEVDLRLGLSSGHVVRKMQIWISWDDVQINTVGLRMWRTSTVGIRWSNILQGYGLLNLHNLIQNGRGGQYTACNSHFSLLLNDINNYTPECEQFLDYMLEDHIPTA